jgi:membrane-associated HD superfamily phosphohydrolase
MEMFSTGQLIFAALFFVAFVIVIFFSYRKDFKLHRKYYKGTLYILLGFIAFILLLFVLKTYLKA